MRSAEELARIFGDAERRGPGSLSTSHRIARLCGLGLGARVLDLGCGTGPTALLLAKEYGCRMTCVDLDAGALRALSERAKVAGVEGRIRVEQADARKLELKPRSFDAIVAEGTLPLFGFQAGAQSMRELLAPNGRLAATTPACVVPSPPEPVLRFWAAALGEPLRRPTELFELLERAGYEPLAGEIEPESVFDEYYRFLESRLPEAGELAAGLREEIDLHRSQGGRQSVGHALVVGRRKEPGERPPPAFGAD